MLLIVPTSGVVRKVKRMSSFNILLSQLQLFVTPVDCSPRGSSVHGILQARKLEWVAISSFRGSSQPRDQTWVSRIAGGFFTISATREALSGDLINICLFWWWWCFFFFFNELRLYL